MGAGSAAVVCLLLAVACSCAPTAGQPAAAKPAAPAKVEADLGSITLTAEAEQRLGIQTAAVVYQPAGRVRTLAGEILVPPGHTLTVSAPVAGTLTGAPPAPGALVKRGQPLFRLSPLAPLERDRRVSVEAEVAAATTRVEAARTRTARADRLLRDKVGSVRAQEDAQVELKLAESALAAARSRLGQLDRAQDADVQFAIAAPQDGVVKQVHAAPGQAVAAGAPLVEVANLAAVWVRVPVYAGEASQVVSGAPATVRRLLESAAGRSAGPVAAPPSADPQAATVDFYYQLANPSLELRPGEKVEVTLPLGGRQQSLQVPWSAVVFDFQGGTWVYENTAAHVFVRRRVELRHVVGGVALLARGPKPGVQVVTAGAAELFGTEFGAGK